MRVDKNTFGIWNTLKARIIIIIIIHTMFACDTTDSHVLIFV